MDLALIWGFLIAVAVFTYVALDGFDLGVAILFPLGKSERERTTMMNTIAPVWDGNETWLVLGGGGLFAVFPLAYSVLMTAFYMPVILMLIALIFRGVAFEFRFRSEKSRHIWDGGFVLGSIVATFFQGVMLGAFIQGVDVEGRLYAGGWFDWLTPFTVFTGLAVIAGYALLGACWLIMKTEGDLQARFYRLAPGLALTVFAVLAIVSIWTPLAHPEVAQRWFADGNALRLAPLPIVTAVVGLLLLWAILARKTYLPYLLTLGVFLLSYVGFGISIYPYIIPYTVTFQDAAAPQSSLAFILAGAVVLLPIIYAYTAYSYWIFRGKVRPGEGYH